ncbi:hypothetical protein Ciccas_001227 [Cichlidogyrus casuarinus]|uniref:FERM C-terminal PH-like domain-containing protein n=1 Tax=Cichlidogyrus casuarinus TaxID=1844966 RepID=A0ABD2QKX3_9PLAT
MHHILIIASVHEREEEPPYLGLNGRGIVVKRSGLQLLTMLWPAIRSFAYRGSKFIIDLDGSNDRSQNYSALEWVGNMSYSVNCSEMRARLALNSVA